MANDSHWEKARFEALWDGYRQDETTPQGRKRIRLLKAATELFVKQGYRKTSVDEIARRAGVAKGTVYNFFPSKAALVIEAIAVEKQVMIQVLDPILSGTLPEKERLAFYVRVFVSAATQLPLTHKLVVEEEDFAEVHDALGDVMTAELRELGAKMIMELIELAVPGRLSDAVKRARGHIFQGLALITARATDPKIHGPLSVEEFTKHLGDLILAGLIAPERPEDGAADDGTVQDDTAEGDE